VTAVRCCIASRAATDRWSQSLELVLGALIPREPARKLGAQKRRAGRPTSMGIPVITACF